MCVENIFKIERHLSFAAQEDKCQEKVFRLRPLGCAVTREKSGGVPSSHKDMTGQVEGKRTDPAKGLFSPQLSPLSGTEPDKKTYFYSTPENCLYPFLFLIENSNKNLQTAGRNYGYTDLFFECKCVFRRFDVQ